MLKSLWTGICVLAIANSLAIVLFFGWLKSSDRLSRDRVEAARLIFAKTVGEDQAKKSEEEQALKQQAAKAEAEAKAALPPVTADLRAAIIREYEERTRQEKNRIQRETENLIETLTRRQEEFEKERTAFNAVKEAFEKQRAEIVRLEGDAQFQKSLKIYQSLKPDAAKAMLQRLIDSQKMTEVIAYLNAMKPSVATKIVAEFQKGDATLAADLLERLKVYGLALDASEEFGNAASPANPPGAAAAPGTNTAPQ
jgi:hypothetical protein